MQENLVVKKATPLGARVWTSLLVFGFIGQIAWMVENVYFSTCLLYTSPSPRDRG